MVARAWFSDGTSQDSSPLKVTVAAPIVTQQLVAAEDRIDVDMVEFLKGNQCFHTRLGEIARNQRVLDHIPATVLDDAPELVAVHDAVRDHPLVAARYR